jgi:electron-transferring-flavoprotein dehydrogenase
MGVGRDGEPTDNFVRGMELRGKYTFFAEGARGSLTKQLIERFALARDSDPQKYGIGLKELWQVKPEKHQPGLVQHTFGWPLDAGMGGGSFLYHYGDNLVSVGFVLHLNYANPYLSPYDEFQRFKTHPAIRATLEGAKRIGYGARPDRRGWQSQLVIPAGPARVRGRLHERARASRAGTTRSVGIAAAEPRSKTIISGRVHGVEAYGATGAHQDIARDLKPCAANRCGRASGYLGIALGGVDMWLNTILPGIGLGFTLRHRKPDYATLKKAADAQPIAYPRPDGVLTFDRLTNVSFSGTNHEENQPVHLKLTDPNIPVAVNLPEYAEPAQRYCPAGVYEIVTGPSGSKRSRSTRRTASTAKPAISRTRAKTSRGSAPKGAEGRIMQGCSRVGSALIRRPAVDGQFSTLPWRECRQIAALFATLYDIRESIQPPEGLA